MNKSQKAQSSVQAQHRILGSRVKTPWEKTEVSAQIYPTVVRPDLEERIFGALNERRPVFLIGSAGLGKTQLARRVCRLWEEQDRPSVELCFYKNSPEQSLRRILSLVRVLSNRSMYHADSLILLDDLVSSDEYNATKITQALTRIIKKNFPVIVTLRPEHAQIFENMGDILSIETKDLLVPESQYSTWFVGLPKTTSNDTIPKIYHATRSIPALLDAYRRDSLTHTQTYLIKEVLRDSLMEEERQLRAGLILLGAGTVEEVQNLFPQALELLQELAETEPFLGIDAVSGTFCCTAATTSTLFEAILPNVAEAQCLNQEQIKLICKDLIQRGYFSRVALIAQSLLFEEARSLLVTHYAADFCEHGFIKLVKQSYFYAKDHAFFGDDSFDRDATAVLLACIEESYEEGERHFRNMRFARTEHEQRVSELIQGVLRAKGVLSRAGSMSNESDSSLGGLASSAEHECSKNAGHEHSKNGDSRHFEALAVLTYALTSLLDGNVLKAYRSILSSGLNREFDAVTHVLLGCVVSLIEELLEPSPSYVRSECHSAFLSDNGYKTLTMYYMMTHNFVQLLLERESDNQVFESALHLSQQNGDEVVSVVALIGLGLFDMRARAYIRANVRFEQASSIAQKTSALYLMALTHLCCFANRLLLGETEESFPKELLREQKMSSEVKSNICELEAIFYLLKRDMDCVQALLKPTASMRPNILTQRFLTVFLRTGLLSHETLSACLPAAWLQALQHTNDREQKVSIVGGVYVPREVPAADAPKAQKEPKACGSEVEKASALWEMLGSEKEPQAKDECEKEDILEIQLMGTFTVKRQGQLISASLWRRHSSRMLLALLAAAPGHKLTRADICEHLWPDKSLDFGRRNLYTAVSSLKTTLGQDRGGPQFVRAYKGGIALNEACAVSDVDVYEEILNKILHAEVSSANNSDGNISDEKVLMWCQALETGFQGQRLGNDSECEELLIERQRELDRKRTDALCKGAEVALAQSKPSLAVRFSRGAQALDPLREDVELILIRSLIAAGREGEAQTHYEKYAQELIRAVGVAPSSALRNVATQFYGQENTGVPLLVEMHTVRP